VKKEEVDDSMRKYRKGVGAWGEVQEAIEASIRATEGIPLMSGTMNRLRRALQRLEQVGDVIACVPELAQSVLDEKDVSEKVRKEAQRLGLILRYDNA
jgi:hypothetical protein